MENWIIWLIISVILMIVEIFTPAFLFGLFSAGALITSIAAYFLPELVSLHILIFAVVSFLLVVFIRKIFIKYLKEKNESKERTNMDAMTGVRTRITQTVNNDENTGAVILNDIRWRVVSENNEILKKGDRVIVTGSSGTKLIVRRVDE